MSIWAYATIVSNLALGYGERSIIYGNYANYWKTINQKRSDSLNALSDYYWKKRNNTFKLIFL